MKFSIWIIMIGLCLLCVGCATSGSSASADNTPGLSDFGNRATPEGGATAAEFARKTY